MRQLSGWCSKRGGTIVELIVVIAMLTILAGAVIPVYGSYVTKAQKVADEQLLAAVNTETAAAVPETDGMDMANKADGELNIRVTLIK